MSHAEVCPPVCKGTGASQTPSHPHSCHGCHGLGWVTVGVEVPTTPIPVTYFNSDLEKLACTCELKKILTAHWCRKHG